MKSIIGILILLSAVLLPNYGQNNSFPLSLISEDIEFLRTEKHYHHSRPDYHQSTQDIYRVSVTVQVKEKDHDYSSPFTIKIIDSRRNETELVLNNNRYNMLAGKFYTFQREVSLNSEGFAKLILSCVKHLRHKPNYDNFSSSTTETTIYISKFQ